MSTHVGLFWVMINYAFLLINGAFHSMALFTFHPNIWAFHLQLIRFHEVSTRLMAIMKVLNFQAESLSVN